MEDLNAQVLQAFMIRTKRIIKEKSYYICATDDGSRVIRKSTDTRERIVFAHAVKEQLHERGFSGTDRYYTTADGAPFFAYEGSLYVMTGLFRQREADLGNAADLEKALKKIAAFHNAARGLQFDQPLYGDEYITDTLRKNAAEIDGIKKLIGQKSRLSDFDVIFLKNYDGYRAQMHASARILEDIGLMTKKAAAKAENAVCHNLLKEEHLLVDGDDICLTGFSQAAIDYFVLDLCTVIRRYAKNLNHKPMGIVDVVEMYGRHRTLSADDIAILRGLLIYPIKFVRICRQYYSKKRTWTPVSIINRMDGLVQGKAAYDRFVEGL